MTTILTGIDTLEQHLLRLRSTPEDYRPERCPDCGKGGLWRHGCYGRKAHRENTGTRQLNPVPIPRFRCAHCRGTCSTLPECLPPRRWYLWPVQQAALVLVLAGHSLRQASARVKPVRKTLRRWLAWLKARFADHACCLRNRFPALGYTADFNSFWHACLVQYSLAQAMAWVQQGGVTVP